MDTHHILPRYKGGDNSLENLIKVSRTSHIMWHYANWLLWGNREDFIAYKGLAGTLKGLDLAQEKRRLAGIKTLQEGKGLFGLPKEERLKGSSRGGKKGGAKIGNYVWITDGQTNSRIPPFQEIPKGWWKGVSRKKPRKEKSKRFENLEEWNNYQKLKSNELRENRKGDLEKVDLSRKDSVTILASLWNVSKTHAKRYMLLIGIEPISHVL